MSMTPVLSNKNVGLSEKQRLFSEKDNVKFEKIMSTRNILRQKMQMKYELYNLKKNTTDSNKTQTTNVRK